ncbi:MAG: hypothetical protein R2779_07670 [Crocinitomicaceae bacterium]
MIQQKAVTSLQFHPLLVNLVFSYVQPTVLPSMLYKDFAKVWHWRKKKNGLNVTIAYPGKINTNI